MTIHHQQLSGLSITVTILAGRNLIAKDRNLMGKRTTSDTYMKVYYCPDSRVRGGKLLGRTTVIPKTCDPIWKRSSESTFHMSFGADAAANLLQQQGQRRANRSRSNNNNNNDDASPMLRLELYDHDKVGADDSMGMVIVPISFGGSSVASGGPTWYPVQKGHTTANPNNVCKNAKGDVQLELHIQGRQMRDVVRGTQKHLTTPAQRNLTVGLAWDVEHGRKVDLDSSVVAVNRQGQIDMTNTVYYGNLQNPNRSLVHSGDEQTGDAVGDDESIFVQLDRIPTNIVALYFLLTIATPGQTFSTIQSAQVRFVSTQTKEGICKFVPHRMAGGGTSSRNTALFLVRIARSTNSNSGGWILTPMEDGSEYAMDFGSLIPEIKAYTRDIIPNIHIDPTERIAIMRKGGRIRLADYIGGNDGALPEWVTFGLAWDVTNGVNIDLDASAIMMDEHFEVIDLVFFKQLVSQDGSVRHSGDEREGDEVGDDEKINIKLGQVHPLVKYIGFIINSYSGQELDDVSKASCHLFDPRTHTEIAKYTMTNTKELDKHIALLMGCLYRSDSDGGAWHLSIISKPSQGRTAHKNVPDLQRYLKTRPQVSFLLHPPTLDEEIDLSSYAMPTNVTEVDDEIVVVPEDELDLYVPPAATPQVVQATTVVQAQAYATPPPAAGGGGGTAPTIVQAQAYTAPPADAAAGGAAPTIVQAQVYTAPPPQSSNP